MNIGRPVRIIEVEPAVLPLPEPLVPEPQIEPSAPEPARTPAERD
jgi:hypothetical protein